MPDSATSLREQHRQETARRISRCAQWLAAERGLDGFTMDDLAERAAVSRRTLFNYFPSKIDAVLGPHPVVPASQMARFVAGGPHGHLVDDVGELVRELLATNDTGREDIALAHRLFSRTPRLMLASTERIQALVGDFIEVLSDREGPAYDVDRGRLLLRLIVTVFDVSLVAFLEDPQTRPLVEHFDRTLATARQLFG